MLDTPAIIEAYIYAHWVETNPAKTDILWTFDEMNSNWKGKVDGDLPLIQVQILFENLAAKESFITREIYRVEHKLKISIFVRPVKYMPDAIASAKTTFLNAKKEVDRILRIRFGISGIYSISLTGWTDIEMAVGRDIKSTKEPITFTAEQIINTIYYEGAFSP